MADSTKPVQRPSKDVATEYTHLCTKMGDLHFKILNLQKDLSLCLETAQALNLEFVSAVEIENKVKAELEAKTQKEGANQ